ncbi:MAG: translation initiation factor IF-2 [Limisphaerales bacterium]
MGNLRIYQLAKENNLSADAMMAILAELGFSPKSHMSAATEPMIAAVAERFKKEKEAIKQKEAEKKRKHAEFEKKEREAAIAAAPPVAVADLDEEVVLPKLAKVIETPQKEKIKPRLKGGKPVDRRSVEESFRKTLADLDSQRKVKKHYRRDERGEVAVETEKIIRVNEFMTVAELAHAMELTAAQVISKCMELGFFATINQRLDLDTIGTLALEFGFKTERVKEIGLEEKVEEGTQELRPRPPVVTIMGHVDHGKTSLLDHIRKTNVIAGEAGGITQHIGAYEVERPGGKITFLDTPGHQAFTAMRARGAQITDIVVLVVAADDAVMPQTVEAIDHAKAAGVPIIVAINKIDLPTANPESIKHQLSKYNLIPEEWGGKTIFVEISAKMGKNIDKLLEMILLQADLLELKANFAGWAQGTVIEARLDKGKGAVLTVLVQKGILRIGEPFVTGAFNGRVRALLDERSQTVKEATPSTPVQILGSAGVPQAGDSFIATASEQEAREVAARRMRIKREQDFRHLKSLTLEEVYQQVKSGEMKELRVIVKGDVDGSVEALADLLSKIGTSEVKVTVIHKGVGAINENDVLLAAASQAIIVGFHVRPDLRARELAAKEKVDIRLYTVIYEAQEEIKKALEGLLAPEIKEKITGTVEVRQVFKISKIGTVAGCYVQSGAVRRIDRIRIIRDGVMAYDGKIEALKRFKDDAREVAAGFECGIKIENFNDIKVGDSLECYELLSVARKLE